MSFRKKISNVFAANIVVALLKFLMLLTIVKYGSTYEVGVYTYGLAIVSPIFLFLSLKIKTLVVTENENYSELEFLLSIIITGVIGIIFLSVFLITFEEVEIIVCVTLLLSLQKLIENIKFVFYGIYQRLESFNLLAKSQTTSYSISFVFFSIIYIYSNNLILSLLFYLLVFGFTLILDVFILKTILMKKNVFDFYSYSFRRIFSIMKISFPLSLSSMIGSLTVQFPRYVLKNTQSLSVLGIFSSISYVLVILGMFSNSISQVFLPRLKNYAENKNYKAFDYMIKRLCVFGFALGISFSVISIFLGEKLLYIIFGPEYSMHNSVLVLLSLSITFQLSGVFIGTSLTSLRIYNMHYKIYGSGLLAVIIFSIILIPKFDLNGAAVAMLISNFTVFTTYLIYYFKYFKSSRTL